MSSSRRSTPMSSLSNKSSVLNQTTGSKRSSDSTDHSIQSTFEWGDYLTSTNSHAAPVSSFLHAPLYQMWTQVAPGMKLEVVNHDCLPNVHGNKERVYWFATVIQIEGYLGLLRYEGYDDDSSMDFWRNLCDKDIHCVGWCGQYGVKLAPPRSIEQRQTDWKTFLVNRLVGSKTLPDNFHDKVQASLRCPFKKNMILEVIDKHRVSQMRVGEITEVTGDRLKIYYDNMLDEHFSVHYTSNLIHPIGWSARVGHEIESERKPKMNGKKASIANAAPADIFAQVSVPSAEEEQFQEGQKLEAVDPLDMSRICPATVVKVLKDGYFMLSIDDSGVDDGADWFCYHYTSRLIFPIKFCQLNNIPLSPPNDYRGEFQWDKYLTETKSTYAPRHLFQVVKEKVTNPFKVGMKLEAVDMMAPHLICVASIAQVADNLIRLHFDGWNENFEQWIDCRSRNIYPIGWCELVEHQLESPKAAESEQFNAGSDKIRRRKSTNRKSNKRKRLT